MKDKQTKTAVLMPGGLGDSLFFLVYYGYLRENNTADFLFIVNEKVTIELLKMYGVSESNVFYLGGAGHFGIKEFFSNFQKIRDYTIDEVLFLPEVNVPFWTFIFKLYGIRKIISIAPKKQHPIRNNEKLLKEAGYNGWWDTIDVSISSQEKAEFVERFFERYKTIVGVHSGSKINKRWPVENYLKVAQQIGNDYNVGFIFFGTEADKDKKFSVLSENILDLYGRLNLRQLFYYIKKCDVFLSNDSGLMHIAALSGVKTIGLFGPTDWDVYYPFGKENIVIHGNLECQPCYNKGRFSCAEIPPKCMRRITVEQVVEAIRKAIDRS